MGWDKRWTPNDVSSEPNLRMSPAAATGLACEAAGAEYQFMEQNTGCRVFSHRATNTQGIGKKMRYAILVAASAAAIATPALADMPGPRYSDAPTYQREVEVYEDRPAPPVV